MKGKDLKDELVVGGVSKASVFDDFQKKNLVNLYYKIWCKELLKFSGGRKKTKTFFLSTLLSVPNAHSRFWNIPLCP